MIRTHEQNYKTEQFWYFSFYPPIITAQVLSTGGEAEDTQNDRSIVYRVLYNVYT